MPHGLQNSKREREQFTCGKGVRGFQASSGARNAQISHWPRPETNAEGELPGAFTNLAVAFFRALARPTEIVISSQVGQQRRLNQLMRRAILTVQRGAPQQKKSQIRTGIGAKDENHFLKWSL